MIEGISHVSFHIVAPEDTATAVLKKIEGRKLTFSVTAHEGDKLIGEGAHVRFIVNKERFVSKLK